MNSWFRILYLHVSGHIMHITLDMSSSQTKSAGMQT